MPLRLRGIVLSAKANTGFATAWTQYKGSSMQMAIIEVRIKGNRGAWLKGMGEGGGVMICNWALLWKKKSKNLDWMTWVVTPPASLYVDWRSSIFRLPSGSSGPDGRFFLIKTNGACICLICGPDSFPLSLWYQVTRSKESRWPLKSAGCSSMRRPESEEVLGQTKVEGGQNPSIPPYT